MSGVENRVGFGTRALGMLRLKPLHKCLWMSLVGVFFLSGIAPVFAWDKHVHISHGTLDGFKNKQPKIWEQLQQKVEVTSIDSFLAKAFGSNCNFEKAKETVFGSLGLYFKIFYAEGAVYWNEVHFHSGLNRQHIDPVPGPQLTNSQAIGQLVTPYDVISIYSDEPDWAMDDDVPALMGVGSATKKTQGSAMRVLRHFWYDNEVYFGYDFGAGQETDKRMQLFYELALVAFSVGEPYWGYRFLGNSLHFLQDITQPYHSKAIITERMINKLGIVHSAMCDLKRTTDGKVSADLCSDNETLERSLILNGWIVAVYHSMFEDFSLAMLAEPRDDVARYLDDRDDLSSTLDIEKLDWGKDGHTKLDAGLALRMAQDAIFAKAEEVGKLSVQAFGTKYKTAAETVVPEQLKFTGRTDSIAYRLGKYPNLDADIKLGAKQRKAVGGLLKASSEVLARAAVWGREFIGQSMESLEESQTMDWSDFLRNDYKSRCAQKPARPGKLPKNAI